MKDLLFVITFLFGIISLLTRIKIFDRFIIGPFESIFPTQVDTRNIERNFRFRLTQYLDNFVFLFSLGYQIYFWFKILS